MSAPARITMASATGQEGTEAGYLDYRFDACRPAFEAMARSVGIQPGWRVLDAGCGSGGFLPILAELVGPDGSLAALDLAADNVARVQHLVAASPLPCPVVPSQGTMTTLPYPDGEFDAVWCANALQYLTGPDLSAVLREFRRVVRPGGLVAIKEIDMGLAHFGPADPALLWHMLDAGRETARVQGFFYGRQLGRLLAEADLVDVWQRATLDEHRAPLQPVERQLFGTFLSYFGGLAETYGVPAADLAFWHEQRDPANPRSLVHRPDFYYCERHYIAVGRVPMGDGDAG